MVNPAVGVAHILAIFPVAFAFVNLQAINRADVNVLGHSNLKLKLPPLQLAANQRVGGIYEFSGPTAGSDPPPEIAELLGIKVKKDKKKSTKKANTAAITPSKPVAFVAEKSTLEKSVKLDPREAAKRRKKSAESDFSEKLEDLEKHVLAKYGSNAFKDALNGDVDWDEMDDERADERLQKKAKAGKFEGFDPANRVKPSASPAISGKGDKKDDKKIDPTITGKKESIPITSRNTPGKTSSRSKVVEASKIDDDEDEEEYVYGAGAKEVVLKKAPLKLGLLSRRKAEKSEQKEYSVEEMLSDDKKEEELEEEEEERDDEDDESEAIGSTLARRDRRAKESTWVGQKGDLKPKSKAPFLPESLFDYEGAEFDEDEEASAVQKAKEMERSGPLNAVSGFRLRRPPAVTAEEQKKLDAKEAALLAKEELQKEKRKMKKDLEKNLYNPFEFRISDDVDEHDQVFTTKSFSDIGIHDPIVLRNLERLNIFNPTKIQAAAIPEMVDGKDVLLHAQTGSGKTLAFLLPLLSTVDRTKRKVIIFIIFVGILIYLFNYLFIFSIIKLFNQQ